MDKDFLLRAYGQCYGPEAGPWNLSVESKYLEYRITRFFEENFPIRPGCTICNIGIGAGYWDRYLSYRLNGGSLTSIDIDRVCCEQLRAGLENEENPNRVQVIHSDVMDVTGLDGTFDLVTIIGSTRQESGQYSAILAKAAALLKPGGALYYQTLDPRESEQDFTDFCAQAGLKVLCHFYDTAHGFSAHYWKAERPSR